MKAAILTPITLLAIVMMMQLPAHVVSQIIIIPSQGQNGNGGSSGSMFPFFQNPQQGQQQGQQSPQQQQQPMFSFQPSSSLASLFNPQTSPFQQQQQMQPQQSHMPNNLFRPNFGGGALPFSNQYQTPESPAVTQSSPGPLPSLEQTLAMLLRPLAGNTQVTQETVPSENSQQRRRRRQQYFY